MSSKLSKRSSNFSKNRSKQENSRSKTCFFYKFVYGKRVLMYIKDHFNEDHSISVLTDLYGNNGKVMYNNMLAMIPEPKPVTSGNPYCWGSCLIPDAETD